MIELKTPRSIIRDLVGNIERERRRQRLRQRDLCESAAVPLPTYKNFIHHGKISLETLLKILFALRMTENIEGLVKERRPVSIEEIMREDDLPERIRK